MTTPNDPGSIMAAHLCDLSGIAFRNGDTVRARKIVNAMVSVADWTPPPDGHSGIQAAYYYRAGLVTARLAPEDIDASVAACMRGEHPADSLMGRVAKMRDDATRYENTAAVTARDWHDNGKAACSAAVLDILEGEGRSAKTAGGGT